MSSTMLTRNPVRFLAVAGAFFAAAAAAHAQDSGPLVDLLVKKGLINDQEAEELKADLVNSFVANTSAAKINLGSHVTEFKLSGDLRLRQQFETRSKQGKENITEERNRARFRFRFNGDLALKNGFGAGFALETGQASDSGNQSFDNGADDYGLYLARAYVSYKNGDLTLTGGKFKNPFYTTDMVWDGDINPQGLSEVYSHKIGGQSGKDTLDFRAGQLIMKDNTENSAFGPAGRDAWQFAQQAVYTGYFGKNNANSFIIAPGFSTYTASTLSGLTNETPFNGTTRYLKIITIPGEVNFAGIAGEGTSLKAYWDFAYNMDADKRVKLAYALPTASEDATAWLVGLGYNVGSGKSAGDWSVKLDYRDLGIGALDVNISDSDFAYGNLNQRGFKLGTSYNVTDFASLGVTYFYTYDKHPRLNQSAVASLDHSQILQLDLVVKF